MQSDPAGRACRAEHVFTVDDESLRSKVVKATDGCLAEAAVDAVGGSATQLAASLVRPGGPVIIYGALGGRTLTLNILDIFLKKKILVTSFWAPTFPSPSPSLSLSLCVCVCVCVCVCLCVCVSLARARARAHARVSFCVHAPMCVCACVCL